MRGPGLHDPGRPPRSATGVTHGPSRVASRSPQESRCGCHVPPHFTWRETERRTLGTGRAAPSEPGCCPQVLDTRPVVRGPPTQGALCVWSLREGRPEPGEAGRTRAAARASTDTRGVPAPEPAWGSGRARFCRPWLPGAPLGPGTDRVGPQGLGVHVPAGVAVLRGCCLTLGSGDSWAQPATYLGARWPPETAARAGGVASSSTGTECRAGWEPGADAPLEGTEWGWAPGEPRRGTGSFSGQALDLQFLGESPGRHRSQCSGECDETRDNISQLSCKTRRHAASARWPGSSETHIRFLFLVKVLPEAHRRAS